MVMEEEIAGPTTGEGLAEASAAVAATPKENIKEKDAKAEEKTGQMCRSKFQKKQHHS